MKTEFSPSRRRLLAAGLGLGTLGAGAWGGASFGAAWLMNPCRASLPGGLADHALVRRAWEDIDPAMVWDCHVHLAGTGDSDSGITMTERMLSPLNPVEYVQRLFYLNAGCAHDAPGRVDVSYVARLENLMEAMPAGVKLMLFAFDRAHDELGQPRPDLTAFHVPDAYARRVAAAAPERFEWVASIHPYRPDCVEALETAVAGGARAVKWLPPAMGIDPASPACGRFYDALARLDVPLITHVGEEKAVHGAGRPEWGNPLRLRRAMERGVRVVMAHCASIGEDVDLDRGGEGGPRVASFELFARMMGEKAFEGRLFADISAITLRNRDLSVLRSIVEREHWHPRLLFGTDYPLPGILPLVSPSQLAAEGMLAADAVPVLEAVREHNPILFDFVLKRHLVSRGARLAPAIFETRRFFDRNAA